LLTVASTVPAARGARGNDHAPTTLRRFPKFRDLSRRRACRTLKTRWSPTPRSAPALDARCCAEENRRSVLLSRDLSVHELGNYLAVLDAQRCATTR